VNDREHYRKGGYPWYSITASASTWLATNAYSANLLIDPVRLHVP
jgi:hypothetical protein